MRKSLFTRYVTVFMLIIFIAFSILSLVLGSNMSITMLDDMSKTCGDTAENVSHLIETMLKPESAEAFNQTMNAEKDKFAIYIQHVAEISDNVRIFVIDRDGNILLSGNKYETGTFASSGIDGKALESLRSGIEIKGYDNMNGALTDRFLYCGAPILTEAGDEAVGAVFACSSADGLNAMIGSMIKTMLLTSLWVFLAALVAVYFLSERVIGPLKDMSRAAKSYATGNFDIRIPVRGHDEVAELASAFNQMATGLQNLENMRSSFLANVSHDLKTPMTTISGFIDAIISGAIPQENVNEYLERIKSEVLRLSRLVRQLLDLSRIQAGDRKFEPTVLDICETARQIVLSFEQKIDEKKLDVEFNCDEERMKVVADKDAIHQILYNLCDNAVKFSKDGGKYRLDITQKDKKIHVSVYNEGQGIMSEDLPFIFERFYKSDKSRGLDKTGVGLGLYIAKTIIDAHGESIVARSEYGKYCQFEFTLQCADNKRAFIDKTAPKD
ncbi:MAG: HAMP domain-containing histidine kinase [Clostridia bacterium]|nr:HAMP domain-containing histidine kinase [Clostridia bacterium]